MALRVGILGGTFDPIHNGHLRAVSVAQELLELDRILVIPAGQPWQKVGTVSAPAEDRYSMSLLATINDPHADTSRIEVDRPGPSYTVDTLRALRQAPRLKDAELYFVTGADALNGLSSWHEYEELMRLATFVGITRPGHELPSEPSTADTDVRTIDVPGVDISSTEVRARVASAQSIDELTTPEVVAYIHKRGLYGTQQESGDRR